MKVKVDKTCATLAEKELHPHCRKGRKLKRIKVKVKVDKVKMKVKVDKKCATLGEIELHPHCQKSGE